MNIKFPKSTLPHPAILTAFAICFLVWFYLFYVTQPVIVYDSISYKQLGEMIYKEGWVEFLKHGPHREFGYAFLVSLSMRLADLFSVSFLSIQVFLQLIFLFSTQIGVYYLAARLRLNPFIIAWAILYVGLSPGLMFSSFILYSEPATYPFVLLILIGAIHGWSAILSKNKNVVVPALLVSLGFFCTSAVKGIFVGVSYVLLIPFLILIFMAYRVKKDMIWKKGLVFLFVFFIFFYLPINLYKLASKYYNGDFTLSDRSGRVLLSSTIPRVDPVDAEQMKALVVFTFLPNHCLDHLGNDLCQRWTWLYGEARTADVTNAYALEHDLALPLSQRQIAGIALREILKNPLQYTLVSVIYSFRILYWEYFFGFAAYPDWMDKVFLNPRVGLSISLVSAGLALVAFLHLCWRVFRNQQNIFNLSQLTDEKVLILFMMLTILVAFSSLSSLCWILDRYILPVASLHILSIAFLFDQLVQRWKKL